jgi:beta-glucanase (GH16 family)
LRSHSSPPRERTQPRERPSLLRTTTSNQFSESKSDLEKWGYPDDGLGSFDPYFGGEKGFILYTNEIEPDDKYHLPADNDDEVYRAKWSDHFQRRSICSTIGGIFLIIGLLCVFIILPVLTFTTDTFFPGGSAYNTGWTGPAWAHVNNQTYGLLKNVRKGLIDPDTPAGAKTRTSTFDGSTLNLVFSDEFNEDNRTFYPGDDPFWTGVNIWYGATQDMEWYDPDAITTGGGTLQLRLDSFSNHNLPFRSGMLNSWNQLCFKGGVFEVSVSLAGPAGVPGLWPGIWTMGNLGRPGFKATTEGVWPYTYNSCDLGITPNQSAPDGLSYLPGQKLSSCTCTGEDHPNPGTGRGAPEIDILEGSVDPTNRIGVVTQSFQVAPFDVFWRPNSNFLAIPNYDTTQMNGYTGGPYQQAISGTTLLNNQWYNGSKYQTYAFEYIPGTSTGKIAWFVGEDPSFIMDGRAIGPNGNVAAREVSQEPMSMVLNLGISGAWGEILMADLVFPTIMHIDYVRIYQKAGQESITCDPPGYPTTEYIKNHPVAYMNPNLTVKIPFLSKDVRSNLSSRGVLRIIHGRRTR